MTRSKSSEATARFDVAWAPYLRLKAAREALGLSLSEMAKRLQLRGTQAKDDLRKMEEGVRPVTGPVLVAAELMAANSWLPIETAPKDGTPLDLWVVFEDGGRRWADARWLEAGQHSCHGPANWSSRDGFPLHGFMDKTVHATHWRQRPLGPSGELPV
jgi:transcriptional regulator with XRE-family HTH domain